MKTIISNTILLVSLIFLNGCFKSDTVKVKNLVCEYIINPEGIDATNPQLGWLLVSEQRGQKQTAYQIIVASSAGKLSDNEGDLWNSGKVESGKSRNVEYKGKTLLSRQECYWKVKVWDKDGKEMRWSNPAFWSIGLLQKEDWKASWISTSEKVSSPYYRKSFNLKIIPERAPLYISSLGYYEIYINGKKVSNDVLAPAVSNYRKRTYYKTYNVASYLKKGKNSIGIWMGTGWYSKGLPGVTHHSPVVRAQLEIKNGKQQVISTDLSWETKSSARKLVGKWRWGNFGGEQLDARFIDNKWWSDESSKDGWSSVISVKIPEVPCTAQKCGNNVQFDKIQAVSVEKLDDSTVVVDFGTNMTAMSHLKFRNLNAGQKITIYYADLDARDPNEAWRLKMGRKGFAVYNQFDEFISAGEQNEEFSNVFNYHGYRYALIEGLNYIPKKEDLFALPVETRVEETGVFSCSNQLYNKINKMVKWTYRALNLGGQTVDCPQRERLGYGDGQTIMDLGCYNFDAATMYTKASQNWWDEQRESGFIPFVAPFPHNTGGGPAWGAMSIIVPWKTYLFYGNDKLLELGYTYMKKYIEYLNSHSEDGVLNDIFLGSRWPNLGDWVPPGKGMDKKNWVDDSSRIFFNSCFRIHLLQIMSKIATILNKDDDVINFNKEIGMAQKAVHKRWFNSNNATYANAEQPYLIFPLQTSVTPDDIKSKVFENFVHTMMVKDKGHLNTGMIGTQITFDYLLENNRSDLIDVMVNKKTYPGWGYMIEKGATTCWEQWNGYFSQIHSCFPYIGGWFYRGLAGIQWNENSPGFKNIVLHPTFVESVDWVNCNYNSHYGNIVSNWKVDEKKLDWEIKIPVNTTATVYVPGDNILLDGKDINQSQYISFIKKEDDLSIFKFESGKYQISSKLF